MWGAIIGLVGGVSQSIQAQGAYESSMDYSKRNAALSQQQMDFNTEQLLQSQYELQSLEAIFGPVRQNLADYYSNMTPETYEARMNENIGQQYDASMKQMDAEMARRGIEGSGIQASAISEISTEKARQQSATQQQSEDYVANQQSQWLQQGLAMEQPYMQQQAQNVQGVNQAYGAQMGANTALSQQYAQQSQLYGQSAAGFASAGMYMYGQEQGYTSPTPTITTL